MIITVDYAFYIGFIRPRDSQDYQLNTVIMSAFLKISDLKTPKSRLISIRLSGRYCANWTCKDVKRKAVMQSLKEKKSRH